MSDVRNCKNCWLNMSCPRSECSSSFVACRHFRGEFVLGVSDYRTCDNAVTDQDVFAAMPKTAKPAPPAASGDKVSDLDKAKLEHLRLRNDILRMLLERMRLQDEKQKQCTTSEREKVAGANGHFVSASQLWVEVGEKLKINEFLHTFLCQNCGEAVQVPANQIGKKIHWKCMTCHQENHFDSDYQE